MKSYGSYDSINILITSREVGIVKPAEKFHSFPYLRFMKNLSPKNWQDYELVDSGNFRKLERFGNYFLIRPETEAIWKPDTGMHEWQKIAHATFEQKSSTGGIWIKHRDMPPSWKINYRYKDMKLDFVLKLTKFKHVGVFPEQAAHWDFIYDQLQKMKQSQPRFLNLFAYTGGASLAAKSAGADVYHVDSIKQVVTWAKDNMQNSNLKDIRWVVEDALKFVQREKKRGNFYHGIVLDPPAFGHGPKGEKWKLEEKMNELLENVCQILDRKEHFLVLNTYSFGFSPLTLENIIRNSLPQAQFESGGLYLTAAHGQSNLALGAYAKVVKGGRFA